LVLIETATDRDAGDVVELYRRVLAEGRWFISHHDEFKGDVASQTKIIRQWNTANNCRFWVALVDGVVVGAMSITGGDKDRTKHVGFIEIYVDQEARGLGVGRALMEGGFDWAEANPILRKLALHVFEDNQRAVELYQRSGFRIEGRLEGEFQECDGSLRNDLVMARWV
jgi:ribosomal protein S18 acetylase RimI-like enzyme